MENMRKLVWKIQLVYFNLFFPGRSTPVAAPTHTEHQPISVHSVRVRCLSAFHIWGNNRTIVSLRPTRWRWPWCSALSLESSPMSLCFNTTKQMQLCKVSQFTEPELHRFLSSTSIHQHLYMCVKPSCTSFSVWHKALFNLLINLDFSTKLYIPHFTLN